MPRVTYDQPSNYPPPYTPQPGKPKRPWWQRWWVIAIGVLIVLGIGGAIGGAGSDSSTASKAGPTVTTTATSVTTTTAPGATTHSNGTRPLKSSVAAIPTPTPKKKPAQKKSAGYQIYHWYQGVSADFQAVSEDNGAIGQAASASDLSGVLSSCRQLKHDVVRFEADPPAPDRTERRDLARAMDHYSTAGTLCVNEDLTDAAKNLRLGTKWIKRGTQRVLSLHH